MKEKLYQLMNWAQIEGIVYSEEDNPGEILGPHIKGNGTLYQAFYPNAKKVTLVLEDKGKKVAMELADEEGFFAVHVAGKKNGAYHYDIVEKDGKTVSLKDPYAFSYTIPKEDIDKYFGGIHYEIYRVLGSHERTIDGVKGTTFAVFVPDAMRVSVVGDFNQWDGRIYPMNRIPNTDIFTLFIPDITNENCYSYEVKTKTSTVYLMNDPYGEIVTIEDRTVSKIHKEESFTWQDQAWVSKRAHNNKLTAVYEWDKDADQDPKELANRLKKQGFSHVVLPSVKPGEGFYATNEFFCMGKKCKEWINAMHKAGIGVLYNWQAEIYSGLSRKEESNFYIANVLYGMDEFHMDGLILSKLENFFYLDYGKEPGQWTPNIYGGNENLEAIEFVKHTNSILMKRIEGVLLLANLDAIWPKVTDLLEEDGLGFHYRYDTDFAKGFIGYLLTDPYFRSNIHEKLTERMIYAYRERFIMAFSHDSVVDLWNKLPGQEEDKFNTLKAAFAYISLLPGKILSSFCVPGEQEAAFDKLIQKCNQLNTTIDALALEDENPDNFQWINCFQRNECVVSFVRIDKEEEDSLLVVANFANDTKESFVVGVPYEGKYEPVFCTANKEFGGELAGDKTLIYTEDKKWDGRDQNITVSLPPFSVSVFSFIPFTEEEIFDIARKKAEEIRLQLEEEAKRKVASVKRKNKK